MNDYNILALGWLEKKCHFGIELGRSWCHFGTMCWRFGLAFACRKGSDLGSPSAAHKVGRGSRPARLRTQCFCVLIPPGFEPHCVASNKKPNLFRLGFPFDTATWARTKDLLLRRQLLYPTELLPHALKYISFFTDLCKGRKRTAGATSGSLNREGKNRYLGSY